MKKFIEPILMSLTAVFGFGIVYAIGNYLLFPELSDLKSLALCVVISWASVLLTASAIKITHSILTNKK
jgi:hypothetical protein